MNLEPSQKQLEIRDRAIAHARENKKAIAKRETDREIFVAEENPVSVFMAGSPGAGKTEASIELLSNFSNDGIQIKCLKRELMQSTITYPKNILAPRLRNLFI